MSLEFDSLNDIAQAMTIKGKGILAADESNPTCKKRFDSIGVESTEQNRNLYRDMLFTTEGMQDFISGVILYDETIRQSTIKDGIPFPDFLSDLGVIPGIKVDAGAKDLVGMDGEKVTEGLDGLDGRLKEYYSLGARFAKWRAVISIGEIEPTGACISANAHVLARYASVCQQNGIVPIVEPEILMEGSHTIEDSFVVSEEVLQTVFYELYNQNVMLEGIILKPNMVLSGYDCSYQADVEEVAEKTINCLSANVPTEVPGIAFLSGGQSDELATLHLNEMNKYETDWNLTFSYGRALQQPALKSWQGKKENTSIAQEEFIKRAEANSLATLASL